ncbi:TlpA family protein disulfide reductase [Pinirhizobacter soli]|uniref:TlpA family protein disulfide reductase n=1 Tax=Pinirhizobacter soli TaxID=2786953 RepID=UPI002029CE62|nr:TlpA disulfide reductase family protein [Pinirhizobacter soli]
MKLPYLAAGIALLAAAAPALAAMPEKPTLQVKTLDGKPFDLAQHRGKWVIVNYWATWCAPCIKEMPEISDFVKTHKNVEAIGLAFEDTDKAEVAAFVQKHPVSYPIAQVDVIDPPKDFDPPKGLPTTYLIKPDGTLAAPIVGGVDKAKLAKLIPASP